MKNIILILFIIILALLAVALFKSSESLSKPFDTDKVRAEKVRF